MLYCSPSHQCGGASQADKRFARESSGGWYISNRVTFIYPSFEFLCNTVDVNLYDCFLYKSCHALLKLLTCYRYFTPPRTLNRETFLIQIVEHRKVSLS